jgi:adenylyltransferase/sulfurtransferase
MDDAQLLRYSRQMLLPQIDAQGQFRLLGSSVLIIGLGGLGSPAAMYLAAAGVGHILINDFDTVDLSNLQRQIAFDSEDIGRAKTAACYDRLHRLNPDVTIEMLPCRLAGPSLREKIRGVDVVLDCSDNFETRFAINAACVEMGKPLVTGAVIRFEGQLAVFTPGSADQPCYNCLYPLHGETDESCVRNGVVAPLPGIIGSMQALETIKLLLGIGEPARGRLLLFDALRMQWQEIKVAPDPRCPTCRR